MVIDYMEVRSKLYNKHIKHRNLTKKECWIVNKLNEWVENEYMHIV